MKKTMLFALLMLSAFSAGATGQSNDKIHIDGVEWELLDKPLHYSEIEFDILRYIHPIITMWEAHQKGYTATWSIKDNELVLESVNNVPQDTLKSIFEKEGYNSYTASWLSCTIRAKRGDCIYSDLKGRKQNYESELNVIIAKGEIIDLYFYHNNVLTDGFALTGNNIDDEKNLNENFPIDLNSYPDLKGKRVGISIFDINVDPCGNLTNYRFHLIGTNISNTQYMQLEQDIKNALYNITWKTLLINGEVKPYTSNFLFPHGFIE